MGRRATACGLIMVASAACSLYGSSSEDEPLPGRVDGGSDDAGSDGGADLDATKPGCTTTPFRTGTMATAVGAGEDWSSLNDALVGDGAAASATVRPSGTDTRELRVEGYGFTVPPRATVTGVTLRVTRRSSEPVRDLGVFISGGGAPQSISRASVEGWPNVFTPKDYGGDPWALLLTPAIVNAPSFGASISATYIASGACTAFIDEMALAVSYCE